MERFTRDLALNGQSESSGSGSNSLLKPGLKRGLHKRIKIPQNFSGIVFLYLRGMAPVNYISKFSCPLSSMQVQLLRST